MSVVAMRDPRAALPLVGERRARAAWSAREKSFAVRWSRALREAYDRPIDAATDLRRRERTVELWWQGLHSPRGQTVAEFFEKHPEVASRHLTAAEGTDTD